MKRSLLYTALGVAAASFMAASCSTEDIDTYNGVNAGIFIQQVLYTDQYGNPTSYTDSATISFSSQPEDVKSLVYQVTIRTIGFTKDYDRPYKVEAIPEESNAVEGEDYDLSENAMVIKAGQSTDRLRVRMLRTPRLRKEKVKIKLRLVPNEHFDVPITELKNSAAWNIDGNMMNTTAFKVIASEEYKLPWPSDTYWPTYFGPFTVAKLLVVNNIMGWNLTTWSNGSWIYGKLDFAASETRKYLQKMADAGTPVLDDDGSYMQLADKYKVNYQAYVTDDK